MRADPSRRMSVESEDPLLVDDGADRLMLFAYNYGPAPVQFIFAMTGEPVGAPVATMESWGLLGPGRGPIAVKVVAP